MSRSKRCQQNKTIHHPNWLSSTVVTGVLAFFFVLATGINNYANGNSFPSYAYIDWVRSRSVLGLRLGNELIRFRDEPTGIKLRRNEALYIHGDNYSMVHLGFKDSVHQRFNLFVQAGYDWIFSYFTFPCTLSGYGDFTIGWRRGSTSWSCKIGKPKSQLQISQLQLKSDYIAQQIPRSGNTNEILVSPNKNSDTLIHISNSAEEQVIDVLLGELNLRSASRPRGLILRQGQRYRYFVNNQRDSIHSIDRFEEAKSSSIQAFLELHNWSRDAAEHIRVFRNNLSHPQFPPPRRQEQFRLQQEQLRRQQQFRLQQEQLRRQEQLRLQQQLWQQEQLRRQQQPSPPWPVVR